MLSSFTSGASVAARAAWVFTLLGGVQSFGCAELTPPPASVLQTPSAPREKTQVRAARGSVDAFLEPGSATEVEPALGGSELVQPSAAEASGALRGSGDAELSNALTERLKLGQQPGPGAD